MYCIQCGTQLAEGAKFCHVCGQQVNNISSQSVETLTKDVVIQPEEENTICEIFDRYFDSSSPYGENLYLADDMEDDEIESFQSDLGEEKFLMLFLYYDETNYGLIVTDKEIIIRGRQKTETFPLNKLKAVFSGKEILADVMYLVTINDMRSMPIYLTGMKDVKRFQAEFMHFIEEVNLYFYPQNQRKPETQDVDIGKICLENDFDSLYFESGNPLDAMHSKKYYKAVTNFAIQSGEHIYAIYDSTVMGNCKIGFALCSSGIYGRDSDKRMVYIPWEAFKGIEYRKTLVEFKIGKHGFNVVEAKQMLKLLDAIKLQL